MATITKRENGKWQAKCRRKGYRAQSKTFRTKADAERWAREVELAMDRSAFQSTTLAEKTRVNEALERYFSEVLTSKKSSSDFLYMIERLKKVFIDFRLIDMSVEAVREFKAYRLQRVKGETVRKELNLLKRFFDYVIQEWQIYLPKGNPVSPVSLPSKGKSRERRLSDGEEQALLSAAETYGGVIYDIIVLAIETGMRRGEILKMEWENLNRAESTIFIGDTKNGESRTVPLSPRALKVILKQKKQWGGKVFEIRGDSVGQAFRRVTKKAKIPDLRFHDLRHEATSRLFERGLQIMEVAAITGHKDLASLKRYTHLRPADLAKKLM